MDTMSPNRKFTWSLQGRHKKSYQKSLWFSRLTDKEPHWFFFLFESRIPLPLCVCFLFWAQALLTFNLNESVSDQRNVHLLTHLQHVFLEKKKARVSVQGCLLSFCTHPRARVFITEKVIEGLSKNGYTSFHPERRKWTNTIMEARSPLFSLREDS